MVTGTGQPWLSLRIDAGHVDNGPSRLIPRPPQRHLLGMNRVLRALGNDERGVVPKCIYARPDDIPILDQHGCMLVGFVRLVRQFDGLVEKIGLLLGQTAMRADELL